MNALPDDFEPSISNQLSINT